MPSRVAVLDLRARSDAFVGDGGLARLAERLEREGHQVVRVDAPIGELDALLGTIAEGAFDAIVVARAWDAAMVDALRRCATLLRLTSGVAGALDDRFDAVVDEEGALAVLAGESAPAPRPRPRTARELRVLRARDDEPGNAGAWPTIAGPADGCPYLVDAAKLPAFARLELDRERVQTRGCTFCLDNTGAYAAASEEETVGQWLAQLRALRADREGRFEVLLVDERPHPHLPRLMRALRDDPSLAPIELLVKSRVDWLVEHEAELAEACALAEASGSVLHVYLVGFESFDAETLALFNKGTTVEDNVRAIALLRSLAARFPRGFEHRRLRAHGFVAFTPWTTPEALLENARVMREVGFEELRAEAWRTRLRLYPRTPLYALAQADGLLTEGFGGRGDRAAEQGYDASFAWRFADARVEAIYAACEGLRARSREVSDADLIELATRLVLRWPGLAGAPEVAHLALLSAIRSWSMPAHDVTATLGAAAAIDLELERLAASEKRALLKEAVPAEEAEGLVRAFAAMGFEAAIVEAHGVDATGGVHTDEASRVIVAVARDRASLDEVLHLQRARDVRGTGELMGYPSCCVEAFAAQGERRDNAENERATLRRTGDAAVHPSLSRLGRLRVISHHPCRADCAASIAIAERGLERLAEASPRAAERARAELARPVLFLDHSRTALVDGRWSGSRFEIATFEPLRWRDGTPRAVELERDGVAWIDASGARRSVAADRALIVEPGKPLASSVRAQLAPPAPRTRWLELTPDYRCNHRCLGCGASSDEGPSLSSRELVRALIDGRRDGVAQLWIGGGEPTLRRDLVPLVREARARGYERVRLQTNAAMLSYAEFAARIAEAGVTDVAVSIKGPDAATHDRLARAPGAFELLCRGIENARACGLALEGDVLLYRSTTALFPEVVRTFWERGVRRFRAWMMAPDARDAEALAEEPRYGEVADAVRDALALGLDADPEQVSSLHSPPCTLDDDRARFFAPELGLVVHDASGHRFRLESSPIEGGSYTARCEGCALRSRCNGVRADYVARHGDAELRPRT